MVSASEVVLDLLSIPYSGTQIRPYDLGTVAYPYAAKYFLALGSPLVLLLGLALLGDGTHPDSWPASHPVILCDSIL